MAQIVCGAPNVAAGQVVGVALPGSVMPDGTQLKRSKLRGVVSEGMILAEDELAIGLDHNGIMVLDDDLQEGTPLADVLPISTDVLELAITSNRPDCLSIYGAAREVHAATGAPLNPPPWLDDPGIAGELAGVNDRDRGAGVLPALHRAAVRGRHDRAVAAVAEGAPDGFRPAPDQQRRRHHQLRDAAHRPAAARVRLGPGRRRRAASPARARRRDRHDARRRRAHARHRHVRHRATTDGADVDRRPDGRRRAPRSSRRRRGS